MDDPDPANAELTLLLKRFLSQGPDTPARRAVHQQFFDRVQPAVRRQALISTGFNHEMAKQIAQDAWHKIVLTGHSYNPARSKVLTWASMITRNCASDEFRKYFKNKPGQGKVGSPDDGMEGAADLESDALIERACPMPSVEDEMYATQIRRATIECLSKLQSQRWPNIQLAFSLYLDTGHSYEEVMEQMRQFAPSSKSINAENVRSWVNKARDQMRTCLVRKLGLSGASYE